MAAQPPAGANGVNPPVIGGAGAGTRRRFLNVVTKLALAAIMAVALLGTAYFGIKFAINLVQILITSVKFFWNELILTIKFIFHMFVEHLMAMFYLVLVVGFGVIGHWAKDKLEHYG